MLENLKKFARTSKDEEVLLNNLYVVMKEFGYTLEEAKSIPLPTFFILVELMVKEQKEAKRRTRNIRKK